MKSKEKSLRIPKTLEHKLMDLDAHLFLLRMHVLGLQQSESHLKAIAAELRTLVCLSSGTEGLLHRLVAELAIEDSVLLHVPGNYDLEHPLVKSMQLGYAPLARAGHGPVEIKPKKFSLRVLIKEIDAVLVNGKPMTHEYLIKAVAQQMGTAHEGDAVEPALVQLNGFVVNDMTPIMQILSLDALLSLEVGERILEEAEQRGIKCRRMHDHSYGDVSIVIRLKVLDALSSRFPFYKFMFYGPGSLIECSITPVCVEFNVKKQGVDIAKLLVPYSVERSHGNDFVVVFSYCSKTAQARTITSFGVFETVECNAGWLHASEVEVSREEDLAEAVELGFLLIYGRLLSSKEVAELRALPWDGYGLWKPSDELETAGPFPD